MRKLLLSGVNKFIQCSNSKSDTYKLGVSKFDAVDNYNFIQVRHKDYHKFIIIDAIKTFLYIGNDFTKVLQNQCPLSFSLYVKLSWSSL